MRKIEKILNTIQDKFECDITTEQRTQNMVYLRNIYFLVSKKLTLESLSDIGKLVNRDHASVLHGIKTLKRDLKTNEDLHKIYAEVFNQHSKHKIFIEETNEQHTELKSVVLNIANKLNELDTEDLQQFAEYRLKPYLKSLETRVKQKEIPVVKGALLRH